MSFQDFARRVGPLPTSGMESADPLPPEQRSAPPPTLAEAVKLIETFVAQYPWQDGPELEPLRDFIERAKGRHGG